MPSTQRHCATGSTAICYAGVMHIRENETPLKSSEHSLPDTVRMQQ